MINIIDIEKENKKNELISILQKAIQSANLNFLIGSGCSSPALNVLCDIEKQLDEKNKAGKSEEAERLIFDFLKPFLESTNKLISNSDGNHIETLKNYKEFISILSKILFERKSNIHPIQATIFTTNYDLFIEKASEQFVGSMKFNDGFSRNPVLNNTFKFSTAEFFNSFYNNGNLYNYKVHIPSINLIKLHGSLSWKSESNRITFSIEHLNDLYNGLKNINSSLDKIKQFNSKFAIVLPRKEKLKDTLLDQTYYDLLRIYANELDKENTVLITEGFSFEDKHILGITKRALRNPTLKLIVFCFKKDELSKYEEKFSTHNNVDIVYSETEDINFEKFNKILTEIFPKKDNEDNIEIDENILNE